MKFLPQYGEEVVGYEVRVLNEREARAAAGILFIGAFIGLTNGIMLGTAQFSEYFVSFFAFDFVIRVINPRYSPSLMLGRFFVQNQIPEYVGAEQKRFAWLLGVIIALPMFYYLVIDFQPNPIKVIVCLICMALLIFESAFSICFGCKIFNLIKKQKATHCPGGICEIKRKDDIQKFTFIQKLILATTVIFILYGTYAYIMKTPDRTPFMKMVKKTLFTNDMLDKMQYEKDSKEFDNDDDFE